MVKSILQPTVHGLYCPTGDFYIDPRRPVKRAVITHAHADHARRGCRSYLCTTETRPILHARIGRDADIQSLDYGETLTINGLTLSLHPAGHILGSAQVRIEAKGHVCVISGDYKDEPDPTCTPLEPLRCHTFVSESTFGLPIFKWPRQTDVLQEIHTWWQKNRLMDSFSQPRFVKKSCQQPAAVSTPFSSSISESVDIRVPCSAF